MSNQIAERTIKSLYVIVVQNDGLDFIQSLLFLCGRENSVDQCSVCLRTELQQTYLQTSSGSLQVCVREGCRWLL